MTIPCASFGAVPLIHDDQPGIWFPEDTSARLLKDVEELKIVKEELIPNLKHKIQLQEIQIENYKLKAETQEAISNEWKSFGQSLDERSTDDKQWFKQPTFIFIMGFLGGALLAVGLSFGLSSALK